MYFLVERCYQMREPVLLVGETGGGKTTVCQLLSIMKRSKLHILNCHQYTETSDFLGVCASTSFVFLYVCFVPLLVMDSSLSHYNREVTVVYNFVFFGLNIDQGFYPVRERSKISSDYQNLCEKAAQSKAFIHFPGDSVRRSLSSKHIFHLRHHHLF